MSKQECGIAIDVAKETVILVGTDLIHATLVFGGRRQTLKDFNLIAVDFVKRHGADYGVNFETIEWDNWVLGCVNPEDASVLLSYLEDPHAEVSLLFNEDTIIPVEPTKPCLH